MGIVLRRILCSDCRVVVEDLSSYFLRSSVEYDDAEAVALGILSPSSQYGNPVFRQRFEV